MRSRLITSAIWNSRNVLSLVYVSIYF
uniref:Uncharacterized protein n=1 Tax=Anguilla anguilla TaxID=7936 RepID=A0A0E9SMP2_ANGAN